MFGRWEYYMDKIRSQRFDHIQRVSSRRLLGVGWGVGERWSPVEKLFCIKPPVKECVTLWMFVSDALSMIPIIHPRLTLCVCLSCIVVPSLYGYVTCKSDLTDKMKRSFFQAAVVSILLYGCTSWTLTKHMEKKLDDYYTRMLRAILNKSWRQHLTKQQLHGHQQPVTKTIKIRRTRHAGHCWKRRDELLSDVLHWTLSQERAKAGRPARTYIQQLCADTGCSMEDILKAMDDREGWLGRVRNIRADSVTWWWWWRGLLFLHSMDRWHTPTNK